QSFLGAYAIRVRNLLDYETKLHSNGVIIRPVRRQEKIGKELEAFAKKGSYRVHEDVDLRRLVAYLNEYPTVIQGDFDPAFLNLPDEILVTVMRDHQKYFAVEKKNGELAAQFLAVINADKDGKGIIRAGHGRARHGAGAGIPIASGLRGGSCGARPRQTAWSGRCRL